MHVLRARVCRKVEQHSRSLISGYSHKPVRLCWVNYCVDKSSRFLFERLDSSRPCFAGSCVFVALGIRNGVFRLETFRIWWVGLEVDVYGS